MKQVEIRRSYKETIAIDFCSFTISSERTGELEEGDDPKTCSNSLFALAFHDVQDSIRERRDDMKRIVAGVERKKIIAPKATDR